MHRARLPADRRDFRRRVLTVSCHCRIPDTNLAKADNQNAGIQPASLPAGRHGVYSMLGATLLAFLQCYEL
jgi:hypothetical protein